MCVIELKESASSPISSSFGISIFVSKSPSPTSFAFWLISIIFSNFLRSPTYVAVLVTSLYANSETESLAISSPFNGESSSKIFTREEIGKMSLEDYQKNESEIMSQLEKGLIS